MARPQTSRKSKATPGLITGRTAGEIIASIEAAIQRGSFSHGQPLPTIRTLADTLGINRNTVASAYRHLSDAGLIEGKGRQGSRIAAPPSQAGGPTFLHDYAAGNPDNRLLPDVLNVIHRVSWHPRGYEDTPDEKALIAYARQRFGADGLPIGELWLANGTFDAVAMILRAALPAGSPIAVEDPCFQTTLGLVRELGHTPVAMAVDEQGVQPQQLQQALQAGAKAVILTPRAQNPYGGSWTVERHAAIADIIARHPDVVVIEDDHFAPLSEFDAKTSIGPNHPNWAIIRSVSKYIGPDLRMAFVNSSVELSRKALNMSAFTYRWVSSVVQKTVLAIVTADDYGAVVQKAAVAYRQRRMCLRKALTDVGLVGHGHDGINVWIPVTDELFVSRCLMEAGWIVRPGSIFRLGTAPAIRVTTSSITEAECRELAELLSNLEGRGGHQRGA